MHVWRFFFFFVFTVLLPPLLLLLSQFVLLFFSLHFRVSVSAMNLVPRFCHYRVALLVITFVIVANITFVADFFFLFSLSLTLSPSILFHSHYIHFVLNCHRKTLDRYDLLLCCRLRRLFLYYICAK